MTDGPSQRRAWGVKPSLALAAGLAIWFGWVCYGLWEPHTYLERDGAFYATTVRALATDLTLEQSRYQPRSWYSGTLPYYSEVDIAWSNVALGARGEYWPKHSYLMPIFATPFFVVLGSPGLLLFNVLQMILLLVLCFKIAEAYFGVSAAASATVFVAVSAIVVETVYRFSHDVFSSVWVAAMMLLFIRRRFAWAGVCAGIAVWAKVTSGPLVACLALAYLLAERDIRRVWLPFMCAAAAPMALYAAANTYMFGAPWLTSYERTLVVHAGKPSVESHSIAFDVPWREGARSLLGMGEGLRAMMPVAFVGLGGVGLLLFRMPRLAMFSLLALGSYVAVFAPYRWAHTRFFLPWTPIVVFGIAGLLAILAAARPWERVERAWQGLSSLKVTVLVLGLILSTIAAILLRRDPPRLSARIARAEVFLGTTPCDYYNPMHQKWECSRRDNAEWQQTGLASPKECVFGGEAMEMIWIAPHPSGEPKRMLFRGVPRGRGADLLIGNPPTSREEGSLELWINGKKVETYVPAGSGAIHRKRIPPRHFTRDLNDVELRAVGPSGDRRMCVDMVWW